MKGKSEALEALGLLRGELEVLREERDRYRDALLEIICSGGTVSRRIARDALDARGKGAKTAPLRAEARAVEYAEPG